MTETLSATSLREEIEEFFYLEADLLDTRRFRDWLDLLADDLRYEVPIRRNVATPLLADTENTRSDHDILWFDEDKATLTKRVVQIETGEHWAEEPMSRVSHLVTNIRITRRELPIVETTSRILICRNRMDTETDFLVGRRTDHLVRGTDGWQLTYRRVLLEQSVLLPKNLTFFL